LVNISKLLVDHKSQNSHLSSTALVQFNSTLPHLLVITVLVPSEVNESITEVTLELSGRLSKSILVGSPRSSVLVLVGSLHHGPCGDHLSPNHTGEVVKSSEARGDVLSTGETNSGVGNEVSNNSKHGNTAVLEFHPAKTVEVVLVSIGNQSQGIEEAEGGLGTEFLGEIGVEGGGKEYTTWTVKN